MKRVTVTLPSELVDEIDRLETNRSSFVLEGVQREVQRRRREALRRSLASPHPESAQVAEEGAESWLDNLPKDSAFQLVDPDSGVAVRWVPDEGWVEGQR